MPGFVKCHYLPFVGVDEFIFLFEACDHAFDCVLKVFLRHLAEPFTGGEKRSLIANVGNFSTGEAGGLGRQTF